jgi:hypothetical protein
MSENLGESLVVKLSLILLAVAVAYAVYYISKYFRALG